MHKVAGLKDSNTKLCKTAACVIIYNMPGVVEHERRTEAKKITRRSSSAPMLYKSIGITVKTHKQPILKGFYIVMVIEINAVCIRQIYP